MQNISEQRKIKFWIRWDFVGNKHRDYAACLKMQQFSLLHKCMLWISRGVFLDAFACANVGRWRFKDMLCNLCQVNLLRCREQELNGLHYIQFFHHHSCYKDGLILFNNANVWKALLMLYWHGSNAVQNCSTSEKIGFCIILCSFDVSTENRDRLAAWQTWWKCRSLFANSEAQCWSTNCYTSIVFHPFLWQ